MILLSLCIAIFRVWVKSSPVIDLRIKWISHAPVVRSHALRQKHAERISAYCFQLQSQAKEKGCDIDILFPGRRGGGGREWVSVLTLKGHSVLLTFHSVSSALHYLQLSLSIKSIYLVSRQCQSPCHVGCTVPPAGALSHLRAPPTPR